MWNHLKDFIKKHGIIIVITLMGALNILNAAKACLPSDWLAAANIVGTVLSYALHWVQTVEVQP